MDNQINKSLDQVLKSCKVSRYKRSEIIIMPGDETDYIYYIKSGFVQVYSILNDGSQFNTIIYRPGDIFPINWLFTKQETRHYVEALITTEVYKIDAKSFSKLINTDIALMNSVAQNLMQLSSRLIERVEEIGIGDSYTKVLSRVLFLAQNYGEQQGAFTIIPIPLTHENIANSIGITRETTSIQLKTMEKKNLIKYKGNFIMINIQKVIKFCEKNDVPIPIRISNSAYKN